MATTRKQKTKPRTNSRTHLLAVRFPLWQAEQLRAVAAETGRSLTDIVTDALGQYLASYDVEKFGIIDDIVGKGGRVD